jgi:hypothetical protein
LGATFNQDWDIFGTSDQEVVNYFLSRASLKERMTVIAGIDDLLSRGYTEEELRKVVHEQLSCGYNPLPDMPMYEWIKRIRALIASTEERKEAGAWFNGDFICIESYAFHAPAAFDPQGVQHFLPPDANDESLGATVLSTLSSCRPLSLDEAREPINVKRIAQDYTAWTESLMERYHYKTKQALLKNMMSCWIREIGDIITIKRTYHRQLESWSGYGADDEVEDVRILADSPAPNVGAALRLAFHMSR